MPFDFLLFSRGAFGERAVCIVLSGTGNDGSAGARAIKVAGGLVIAQDPEEAEFDGMPRAAIRPARLTSFFPWRRCRKRSPDMAVIIRQARRERRGASWARRSKKSSNLLREKLRMISRSTRRARWSAGSSGEWHWPVSRRLTSISSC
jgi:hypothetical protein